MLRASSPNNLTHQLVHELGKAIIQGQFDGHFPSEAELSERFQISRTATREAVKMLAAKGLIISRPRTGIMVQKREHWNLFDPDVLDWILKGTPSLQTLRDFMQLRLAIEPQAAALAARNAQPEDLKQLQQALKRMADAELGLEDSLTADIDFHLTILKASGNPFFMQLRSFIETALRVSIRFTNYSKGVETASVADHDKIYQAIVAGDADTAARLSLLLETEALQLIEQRLSNQA